jgi:ABC-2 type transport system ATP-binding protein
MPIVSVRGLTKSYAGAPPALKGATFDVEPGVTGLLGPNGAGKSTWIQCVLGLFPDMVGDVTVLGRDVRADRREVRRRVGFLPETDTYLHDMTGLRAVRYLGQLSGMPYREALRRAHEVLWHVGLGEAVYRGVHDYSTGMRQRFKLAQALVHDPEILFLDEPSSGLDPKARDEFLDLIVDLAKRHGKHVIWSSHILPEVQKVADRIVVLHRGQYRGAFSLDDLRPSAQLFDLEVEAESDGAVEAFAEALRNLGARAELLDAEREAGGAVVGRQRLAVETSTGPASLFAEARRNGLRLRRVSPQRETLEDVFLRLLDDAGEGR